MFVMIKSFTHNKTGQDHIKHIRVYQNCLHELNGTPIRGNDKIQECSKQSYIIKIPTEEFEYFENKCLPDTVILG